MSIPPRLGQQQQWLHCPHGSLELDPTLPQQHPNNHRYLAMDLNPLKQSMLLSQASLKLQVEIKKQNLHLRQLEAKLQAREKCAKESSSQVQSQQTFQQKIPAGKMVS